MRLRCKIANSDEGMDKLMEHTLQRQMAEMKAQMTKMTEMMQAIVPGAAGPVTQQGAGSTATIMTGPVSQQQVNIEKIEKIEINAWDSSRAIAIDIAEILAALAENKRLQEFVRLPGDSFLDLEIAPPYVADIYTDFIRRGHANPAARNIYLNPRRADQVLVHMKGGGWEVRSSQEGYRALMDGVAMSVHEITLSPEKMKQLPMEAQHALGMAGLLYNEEPEEYVKRARAALTAHLTNMAPALPPH
jgi:hypothetical protein